MLNSEKEGLISDSDHSSPVKTPTSAHMMSHVTPALVARPDLLPSLPLQHSTPIIETSSPEHTAPHQVIIDEDDCSFSVYNETTGQRSEQRHHLDTGDYNRLESRHASISHSLSGNQSQLSIDNIDQPQLSIENN